jgi:hypothetical protein
MIDLRCPECGCTVPPDARTAVTSMLTAQLKFRLRAMGMASPSVALDL